MTRRWKIVTGLCAFLVAAGMTALVADACFLHEPPKREGNADKEQSESQVSTHFLSSSTRRAICGLLGQIEPSAGADKKPASPESPKWTDTVQAISASLVAALTIILLVITGKQFKLLIRSTQVAENTLLLARQTGAAQLRAYVTLDRINTDRVQVVENLAGISFVPVWKNSGATPARNVQYYTVCDFSRTARPREQSFPILSVSQNRTIIGPGIDELGPATQDIPDPMMLALARANHSICIYGAIDYTDFHDVKRRTEFCAMIFLKEGTSGQPPFRFTKTAAHNGADEDCMREPYATATSPLRNPSSHSSETSKVVTDP